jgi:transposase
MIVAQREMLRLAQGELTVSRLEIERYKLMLAKARREQYGQSSERARHLIEQLELTKVGVYDIEELSSRTLSSLRQDA